LGVMKCCSCGGGLQGTWEWHWATYCQQRDGLPCIGQPSHWLRNQWRK